MKKQKTFKASVAVLLTVLMLFTVFVPLTSFALTLDGTKLQEGTYFTSRTEYAVAPGITEHHITTNDSTGVNQVASYVLEVDLSNPTTSIIAGYKDYKGSSIGFQKVRDQAYAAESKRDLNVVAGINADFFNMQTGETQGALVMNGVKYHSASGRPYFGITSSGEAVISTGKLTSDIVEAVGGDCLLVQNGEITQDALTSDLGSYLAPRTAVGITADGKVLLYVCDGRQAPYSKGQMFDEMAYELIALGCETAMCLDGGGSTTFISQHEGSQDLVCRNNPSDGTERTVASSLLVCSTAKPSGVFDHATLTPNNNIYTPDSVVEFKAVGVDSAGYEVDLPADGTFALADDSFGAITADGVFTSNGTTGTVTVNYISGGMVCGSVSVEVQIPDELYVANTEQAVGPGVTTDFGIIAKYNDREVILQDDDIEWSIIDQPSDQICYAYFDADNFNAEKFLDPSNYGTFSSGGVTYNKVTVEKLDWDCEDVVLKLVAVKPTSSSRKIPYVVSKKLRVGTEQGLKKVITVEDASTVGTADNPGADLNGIAGDFSGLTFTGAEEKAYNSFITATLKCNTALSQKLAVFIGSKQTMLYDFEYVTGEENKDAENYIASYTIPVNGANWLTANGYSGYRVRSEELYAEGYPFFMWPNASVADNDSVSAQIVSAADGEPVRFGDQSLRISFDYSSYDFSKNSNFYIRATSPAYAFEGSPTSMGVWVYAPEGTANYHLYLCCANGMTAEAIEKGISHTNQSYQRLTEENGDTIGINWTGWKYLEFDLTGLKGYGGTSNVGSTYAPYGFNPGANLFYISYQPSVMDETTADTIYIDDITLVYGANTKDTINPTVNYIGDLTAAIVDGETVFASNTNTFKATYADVEDKYMTDIDDAATKMYIDGVDVTDKCFINEGDNEIYFYDAVLADGVHNIEIEVADVFGNKTTDLRYFTIDSNSEDTEVAFEAVDEAPVLGKDYMLAVTANNEADVLAADITVKILSNYRHYWHNVRVEPAANYELDGEAIFDAVNHALSFKVVRKANASAENDNGVIANIVTAVPTNVPDSLEVTHRIAKGALTLAGATDTNYTAAFSGKITATTISPFVLSSDVMIVGAEGGYIYVKDVEGAPVAGANVYTSDNILLGVTDAEGKVYTADYITETISFSVYAEKEGVLSFIYKTQSFLPGADATGTPTYITLTASEDSSTQQRISWMSSPLASADKAVVKYATKAAYEADGEAAFVEFNGNSYLDTAAASGNIATNYAVRFNSAVLTGLEEAAEYVYIVGDGTNWSPVKTFKTERAGVNTNFFVFGDMQSQDTANTDAVFAHLAASGVNYNFGIQTGDAVDNAGSYAYWEAVGGAFSGEYVSTIDVVHVMGNHEYTGDDAGINAAHYFNLPGTTDEAPLAYSVEYGNVYVAVLDYLGAADMLAVADLLVADAAASNANWKVLTLHQPPYFTNIGGGSTRAQMDILVNAIDTAGIDVVFSGHDHTYAKSYPVTAGQQVADGTVYFICAATTPEKDYQVTMNHGIHQIATNEYNSIYLTVSTTDTSLEVNVWDYDGENHNLFDSCTLTREVSCSDLGHDNMYSNGYLTCKVCGYTQPVGTFSGFVNNAVSGKLMYLIGGTVQTGWATLGEDNYIFDENGEAMSGSVEYEGYTYKCDENGKLIMGALVKNEDGTRSYYINGVAQRGWFYLNDNWYYFSRSNGYKTCSGEKSINKMIYTFSSSGKLIKGAFFTNEAGTSYYWGPYPVTGLYEVDGELYYFNPENTYMVTEDTVEIDGVIYAFDRDGIFRHYDEHYDGDDNGYCDDCPDQDIWNRILRMLRDFFRRIIDFFKAILGI
ncbi:MAG: hypothetical protein E7523_00965 [Ruminococcaceae bacterium]|nr:hypothetical protein [Oscillospiraceae bacterium]